MNRHAFFWLSAVLLTCVTGCVPGITWLPDSSGFVYVPGHNGEKLVHFDLTTKKQRTLISDEKLKTLWPAISPDGKNIAVAKLTRDKKKGDTLQICIYDLNGTSKKQSKVFSLPKVDKGDEHCSAELFWGPPDNKILVSSDPMSVGIYDVKTDELKVLKDSSAVAIGGKPARPDGKGFLVAKWRDKSCTGISWVDWDGKEQPFTVKPKIGDGDDKTDMLLWPYMFTSSWQGAKAQLSSSKIRFEIDTDKLLCKISSLDPGEPNGENLVRQQFAFPNSPLVVRVLDWTKQVKGVDQHLSRLELVDTRQNKIQKLVENEKANALFPSPDGKLIAVRLIGGNQPADDADMILVLDSSGQILAKVKAPD
jgi:hypothetical protein